MGKSTYFNRIALHFHGRALPEEATVVGYGAIIDALELPMPLPLQLSAISQQNRRFGRGGWEIYPNAYLPETSPREIEALHSQLVFALKYEGVNLLAFKKLTQHYGLDQLNELVEIEPTGQYTRRIWFLLEWLGGVRLESRQDMAKKNYVKLLDDSIQYAVEGVKSPRHLIINNLPGNKNFCPLVYKTPKLKEYSDLLAQKEAYFGSIHKDMLHRAGAFLLLKDSKASFSIEGESPKSQKAVRWGQAIGQAGMRILSKEELARLQKIVIENARFLDMGYRQKGGFVGEHNRSTGEPMPDHISAKWQDIDLLMDGFMETARLLLSEEMDAVVCAAAIAFGFVFIHPFQDGNGRLHRYLIHHVLAQKGFSPPGIIFPVSAIILEKIDAYKAVLESYSLPLLDFIEWEETKEHNVEVTNDTIDFYRYFDATKQAEFLYECVYETLKQTIPQEVDYLSRYDAFRKILEGEYGMPERLISLLSVFLEQGNGTLSKRAREKEFAKLADHEIAGAESAYKTAFMG